MTAACEHGVYGKGMCRDCRPSEAGDEEPSIGDHMAAIVRASNCIHGERLESLCEGAAS